MSDQEYWARQKQESWEAQQEQQRQGEEWKKIQDQDSAERKERERPLLYPSASGGGGASAVVIFELLRWKSLVLWAVVVAIFYHTPLWRLATPTSIWTPVVFAVPLTALAITSRAARPFAGGCLILLVLGSAVVFWMLLKWNPDLNLFPSLITETSRQEQRIDKELSECKQQFAGQQEIAALGCYQRAAARLEAEVDRASALILQRLNNGPRGKSAFLQDVRSWKDQQIKKQNSLRKQESANPRKEMLLAKERMKADLERATNLATALDRLPKR